MPKFKATITEGNEKMEIGFSRDDICEIFRKSAIIDQKDDTVIFSEEIDNLKDEATIITIVCGSETSNKILNFFTMGG